MIKNLVSFGFYKHYVMNYLRFFFFLLFALASGQINAYDVLVSVAPHKYFVEQIAGDQLSVGLVVPAGASSHTYEPTPRQMIEISQADIWFQIGESFEARASQALRSHQSKMKFVDLQKGLDLIYDHHCGHADHQHHSSCVDPHFWLSVRQGKIQARSIAAALTAVYPQHSELFSRNLTAFIKQLEDLDTQMMRILSPLKERTILVSHPAYAYFCRDYMMKQLSVEFEGKDPTPRQLTSLIHKAKTAHINKIFIQMQYSNKGAKLVAKQLNAEIITLDPYAENYPHMMIEIAKAFLDP